MLNPRWFPYYAALVGVAATFKFGNWYQNHIDKNMDIFKNKSKLFGGRIIYPEEKW